jgi:hypothetical protein
VDPDKPILVSIVSDCERCAGWYDLEPHQQEGIEGQLDEIDMTLDFLDEGELGETGHTQAG